MANWFDCLPKSKFAVGSSLLGRVIEEWNSDDAMSWSASVAFYTLLSLAPLSILMVAIAGWVFGRDAAQGAVVQGLRNLVSPEISLAAQNMLTRPQESSTGLVTFVFGGLILLFGASSVLTELRDALNAIWHVAVDPNATEAATLFRLLKERLYSFAVILGCGLLLGSALWLKGLVEALGAVFSLSFTHSSRWFDPAVFAMSFCVITFVFAAIYKVIPDVDLNWSEVTVGGLATSLLFAAGKQLISLYVSKTNFASAYGAAGSLVVVLVWVYYSAQVFFLGAEFTKVYAETFGSHKDPVGKVTSS